MITVNLLHLLVCNKLIYIVQVISTKCRNVNSIRVKTFKNIAKYITHISGGYPGGFRKIFLSFSTKTG